MCDVTNKSKYMIHYRMFKFYLNQGMKVTKIHTIYCFKQSPWLGKYIDHNTQKRTVAKTNFEKNLYKLLNNAFFGKTMENVRDRTNLEFIDHSQIDQIIKRQSKLSFKGIVDHYSKFSVYKFDKEKTVFDKPICLGFTVLELSKLLMFEFYYNKLQPYWKQSIQLHYMVTDSFILSFDTNHQELINFLQENKDEFDFSELHKSHEFYDPINKKVIGKMKIETSPVSVLDTFTALRSKSYSFSYNNNINNNNIQKAKQKGIQKAPKCEEYQNSLFNSETSSSTNISIRSNLHNLTVEKQNKLALNPFDDKRLYINPIQSWLCENSLDNTEGALCTKVRDHDHRKRKYRGAAHNICIMNCKQRSSSFVPIFFHNFSGYDCHLIFEELLTEAYNQNYNPTLIPKSLENYVSVQVGCLSFLDSYRFLSSSLDILVKSLDNFPIMKLKGMSDDLFKKKLAYPYEYLNLDNFDKPQNLTKEDYWSTLTQCYPSDDDIKRTQELIDKNKIENGRELTMLYLKIDVLQLADVFENFVESSTREYEIKLLYSYSLPGYTWKAGLKLTDIKLVFIKDKNLLLLLENNIRGGISSVMGDRHVQSDENKQILYIDANELYGWAMSQYLPTRELKKLQLPENYSQDQLVEDLLQIPDDNEYGYFIECDLEYPVEIKEKTKNFPFCPYQTKADPDLFSGYMNSVNQPNYKPTSKLMCDVTNKSKYMIQYRMFKFYLNQGMKVTKIHTIYCFKQSPWLGKYIDHNTQKRTVAKTNFEKNLYKLLNNAFFGKTMENVRDRTNLEFIDHSQIDQIIKRQSKLSFKGIVDHYSKFSVYTFDKEKTVFDKQIYLGFTVSELSKLLMFEFYYNKLQTYWKQSIQLHYMVTDSFILSFDTNHQELIKFLQENKYEFDFSELHKSHELYDPINKKVIGKTKIETSPVLVLDTFTALRSKSYSFSYNNNINNNNIQKAKQKRIQKAPKCEEYQNSLFNSETSSSTNLSIRSNLHNLTVEKQNKLALKPFDDKRLYINPIQSLPWDKHTRQGDCPCIFCLKLIGLYYKDLTINDDGSKKTDEEHYLNVWYQKENLTHQQLVKLISDRAHVL